MEERLHPRQERYLGRRPHLHRVTATTWHTASTAFVSLQASLRTTVAASTARQPLVEVRGKRAPLLVLTRPQHKEQRLCKQARLPARQDRMAAHRHHVVDGKPQLMRHHHEIA